MLEISSLEFRQARIKELESMMSMARKSDHDRIGKILQA